MQTQNVDAANAHRVSHRIEVRDRLLFCAQMAKAVNHIERSIARRWELKITHVCNKCGFGQTMPFESAITEVDRLFVQVQSGDRIVRLAKAIENSSRPTSRLEYVLHIDIWVPIDTLAEEIIFRFPI